MRFGDEGGLMSRQERRGLDVLSQDADGAWPASQHPVAPLDVLVRQVSHSTDWSSFEQGKD